MGPVQFEPEVLYIANCDALAWNSDAATTAPLSVHNAMGVNPPAVPSIDGPGRTYAYGVAGDGATQLDSCTCHNMVLVAIYTYRFTSTIAAVTPGQNALTLNPIDAHAFDPYAASAGSRITLWICVLFHSVPVVPDPSSSTRALKFVRSITPMIRTLPTDPPTGGGGC